ncbi:MAG: hypothetical protein ACYCSN_01420 [Acidobacteriaceae bacterium]
MQFPYDARNGVKDYPTLVFFYQVAFGSFSNSRSHHLLLHFLASTFATSNIQIAHPGSIGTESWSQNSDARHRACRLLTTSPLHSKELMADKA